MIKILTNKQYRLLNEISKGRNISIVRLARGIFSSDTYTYVVRDMFYHLNYIANDLNKKSKPILVLTNKGHDVLNAYHKVFKLWQT